MKVFRTAFGAAVLVASLATLAYAMNVSAWGAPEKIDAIAVTGNSSELNTPYVDGCPIQSPDGLSLYIASNRDGFVGPTRNLDIWVAQRESTDAPWGAPEHPGGPVNSAANDFCPTPLRGNRLLFVSERGGPGSCGAGDIYLTRLNPAQGWSALENLGCQVNSASGEAGPSYIETDEGTFLYFSSGPDMYISEQLPDGSFGPAAPVKELNSTSGDFRPNVRKDGLEIVFDSDRPDPLAQGGFDLYSATRESVDDPWSMPVNLGAVINTDKNETRGSFSWDAKTLYFGRTPGPEGMTDIYVTTRDKLTGADG